MPSRTAKTREDAVAAALSFVDDGRFVDEMRPRIAVKSESPREDCRGDIDVYLNQHIRPLLEEMDFKCRVMENPCANRLPALFGHRIEDHTRPTILLYGHADVLWGMAGEWKENRDPWTVDVADGLIYGRGMADNKGQHSINLSALRLVLSLRGRLGFNVKVWIESSEETGSIGLAELATQYRDLLSADCLIASDGPRISADSPTVFLGCRGTVGFRLTCNPRVGAYHSGNWGGLLPNPAIRLSHALASITTEKGRILVPEWLPAEGVETPQVRDTLASIKIATTAADPTIDDLWGEPGRTAAAQVYGWCNFEILAFTCGQPDAPVSAIPDLATATCHLRFVVGVEPEAVIPALRKHLDERGFQDIDIKLVADDVYKATRTDPANPWPQLVLRSMKHTSRDINGATEPRAITLLPNFGGSLPNHVFAEILAMPTVWIPHSYPACAQHAPNEHMPLMIAREGMQFMTGVFWDIGDIQSSELSKFRGSYIN